MIALLVPTPNSTWTKAGTRRRLSLLSAFRCGRLLATCTPIPITSRQKLGLVGLTSRKAGAFMCPLLGRVYNPALVVAAAVSLGRIFGV